MYYNRVIPCLLLEHRRLVKTVKFRDANYIGDPINALKIFNEKAVDEVLILDRKASSNKTGPDFHFVQTLAEQCFMPMAYGGGVRDLKDIRRLFETGVEKVSVNTLAFDNPRIVREAVRCFGSQSLIGAMDVKRNLFGQYTVYTKRGRHNTNISPARYARYLEKLGVGEIFLNNISRDGMMCGYDLGLLHDVCPQMKIPVTVCGGAGKLQDFKDAITDGGANAVAAGSLFVYHGSRQSILINYPDSDVIRSI